MFCQECGIRNAIYKCPSCFIRTCCVDCVKKHKVRTHCTGVAKPYNYLPLNAMNDNTLFSDISFLEQKGMILENHLRVKNMRFEVLQEKKRSLMSYSYVPEFLLLSYHSGSHVSSNLLENQPISSSPCFSNKPLLPSPAHNLSQRHLIILTAAKSPSRMILLRFSPTFSARHSVNNSYYDVSKDLLYWTLELVVPCLKKLFRYYYYYY
jgi:hypothetical protein